MDKFEEMMQMMSKMTKEERKKNAEANKALCICPDCPSYNDCAKKNGEIYYCGFGKSPKCITKEAGCICPACPITEKFGLTKQFFCTRGTEREQRGMK